MGIGVRVNFCRLWLRQAAHGIFLERSTLTLIRLSDRSK